MSQPTIPPETTPPASGSPPASAPIDITRLALTRLGYAVEGELPPAETPPEEVPPETPPAEPPVETPPAATPPAEPPAQSQAVPPAPAGSSTPPETPRVKKKAPAPVAPPAPTAAELVKGITDALRANQTPPIVPPVIPPAPALPEFDREELELARFAAEVMPDKYKGQDEKLLAYFQKRDAEIQAIIKEDGEFDPQGERFQKFMREQRPILQGSDKQKLIREQIKRETMTEMDRKLETVKEQYETRVKALAVAPVIRQETAAAKDAVLSVEDDVVKAYKADPAKAIEDNPLEAPIIHSVVNDVERMTEEYLNISNGLVKPDAKNPIHEGLAQFIDHQGKLLDAMPEEQRTGKDGRVFISRDQYGRLAQAQDPNLARYATVDDRLVVDMLKIFGQQTVKSRLAETRQRIEKAGYKRTPAAPPPVAAPAGAPAVPPVAPPPKPPAAPKATTPPAAPPPQRSAAKTKTHLSSLGYSE